MKTRILILSILFLLGSCQKEIEQKEEDLSQRIKVLNIGTFHMGYTSDKHQFDFDVKANKNEIIELNRLLAGFKPTIILVEVEPKYQEELEEDYNKYKNNPNIETNFQNEVQFIAFEVGRLANTKRIYGIDTPLEYDYPKMDQLAKDRNERVYLNEYQRIIKLTDSINSERLIKRFIKMNEQRYYDAMININADLMTYVNTDENFEGADTASDFYQRNLRMFANINRIKVSNNDRILLLCGASHSAFFQMFMERSPKYELVPITSYLK